MSPEDTSPINVTVLGEECGIRVQIKIKQNVPCGPFALDVCVAAELLLCTESSADFIRNILPLNSTDFSLEVNSGGEFQVSSLSKGLVYPSKTPAVLIRRTVRTANCSTPEVSRHVSVSGPDGREATAAIIGDTLPHHVVAIMIASTGLLCTECEGESVVGLLVGTGPENGNPVETVPMLFVEAHAQERSDNFLRHLLPAAADASPEG